jgi:hypothetical protein
MRLPLPQFKPESRTAAHVAEVIETSTTHFLAQCLEPEELNFPSMPAFGSWVKSQDEESGHTIMAIVVNATTAPIDSIHRARALGLTLEELRQQQPQIFAMLKTEFTAVIMGFISNNDRDRGKAYQYLPPRPPQIHQSVHQCTTEEIIHFTQDLSFLRLLLAITDVPSESLISAVIRTIYQTRKGERSWLVKAGRELSLLLKDDYDKLRYILSQIHA